MEKFLLIIRLLAVIVPVLIEAIKAVEAAMPESGLGKQKLEIVRTMVESAYAQMTGVTVAFSEVWPMIERLIAAIVASYNAIGTFKK